MRIMKAVMVTFTVLILGFILFCNPSDSRPAQIKEMKVKAKGTFLQVRLSGNPNADNIIIAVNGGPGQSSYYMQSLEQLASENLGVLTYDQRGTGRSTESPNGYDLLMYVEDNEAVRKAVGAKKVHIIGHSWGGIIAMRYATVYPQNVKSIILIGSGPPSSQPVQAGQARMGQRIEKLQQQGIIPKAFPSEPAKILEAILPAYFSDPNFKIPKALSLTDFNAETNRLTMEALADYDFNEQVAELTHPVLLMWGEDDPFGLPMAEATRKALSQAPVKFIVLKGCGHYWFEQAEAFFSHIKTFIQQSTGR